MRSAKLFVAASLAFLISVVSAQSGEREEARAVQEAMLWTGHFEAMVDGVHGRLTRQAVNSWQRVNGFRQTGWLTRRQLSLASDQADRAKRELGWDQYVHPRLGIRIGYPKALMPTIANDADSATISSLFGNASLTVVAFRFKTTKEFQRYLRNFEKSIGQVTYKRQKGNWFVVTGYDGEYKKYGRVERRGNGWASFMLTYPDNPKNLDVLPTALVNSFFVPERVALNAAVAGPSKPAYDPDVEQVLTVAVPELAGGDVAVPELAGGDL